MAGKQAFAPRRRIDAAPMAATWSPHGWSATSQVPSALLRGMRFALLLAAGFWSTLLAIGYWMFL